MSKIEKTTDYSIFKKHANNREISNANVKALIFSIKSHNLLSYRPILVNESMEVIDGQHRLEAAKQLGVEVFYQIKKDSTHEDIVLINNAQKKWTFDDYLNYYCSLGSQEYIKMREYAKKHKMGARELQSLVKTFGQSTSEKFKKGVFTFFSESEVEEMDFIIKSIDQVLKSMVKFLPTTPRFIGSFKLRTGLTAFIKNKQVDIPTLLSKISYKADSLRACASSEGYYAMFRDIYNWRNQNPVE